jgi:SAM-dependent methyltransferase
LRWTAKGQQARYVQMLRIDPALAGARVLDYGCGMGDFAAFLDTHAPGVTYTGIDINPRLIEIARRRNPRGRFLVLDIEEDAPPEDFGPFDYVFVIGVFNNRIEGATEAMKNAVARLFPLARRALGLSCISSYSATRDADINYVSPEEMVSFALGYVTPHVTLLHEHVQDDLTLFLYKKPVRP